MQKKLETDIKVGLFVSIGLGFILLAILLLGSNENLFSGKNHYTAHFANVDGLIVGAKTILGGVSVGTVEEIGLDSKTRSIRVQFSVEKKSADWIRENSTVEIATQGVLGDKYMSIQMGSDDKAVMPPGSEIQNKPSRDLMQFLSKGDQLMVSLNGIASSVDRILKTFEADNRSEIFFKGISNTAKNLSQASDKLDRELTDIQVKKAVNSLSQILDKINNGTGTIGALINDPSLYDQLTALFGGANRNRVIRNLVRQTVKSSEENKESTETPAKPTK